MTCDAARAVLARAADPSAASADGATRAAADRHLAACGACRARFGTLARAVLSADGDEVSCAECVARLGDAIERERGGDGAPLPARIAAHLSACALCHGTYVEARAAVAALAPGGSPLPRPAETPAFDLSFLGPAPPAAPAWPARWAAALAALVGLAGLSIALLSRGSPLSDEAAATLAPDGGNALVARAPAATVVVRAGPRSAATTPDMTTMPPGGAGAPATEARPSARSTRPARGPAAAPALPPAPTGSSPTPAMPTPAAPTPSAAPPVHPTDDAPGDTPAPTATPTPLMLWRCEPSTDDRFAGALTSTCDVFPNHSEFDVYEWSVGNRSRWTFSLCGRTALDTVVAVYAAGGFDPAAPCGGIIALNDDFCHEQSRLTVTLDPGTYWLVIAEKTGDVSGAYAFKTEAEVGAEGSACPVPVPLASPTATPTETATAPMTIPTATPTPPPLAARSDPRSATPASSTTAAPTPRAGGHAPPAVP